MLNCKEGGKCSPAVCPYKVMRNFGGQLVVSATFLTPLFLCLLTFRYSFSKYSSPFYEDFLHLRPSFRALTFLLPTDP